MIRRRAVAGYVMRSAFHLFNGHSGVDVGLQRNVVGGALVRPQVLDFLILFGSAGIAAGHCSYAIARPGRVEAGTHNHWKDKFVPTIGVLEGVEVFDIYVDFLAGLDVCHGLGEDVWPFLSEQSGDITLSPSFKIDPLRLVTFANDATNTPFANYH